MNFKTVAFVGVVLFAGLFLWRFLSPAQITKQSVRSITAGGAEGYDAYTISVPRDWSVVHDGYEGLDKLTISNNGHALRIAQEPGGGITCLYEKNGSGVDYPLSNYPTFTEITTKDGTQLRRGLGDQKDFEFCEKKGDEWSSPTRFGYIMYVIPENPDDAILKEMDAIIASLRR